MLTSVCYRQQNAQCDDACQVVLHYYPNGTKYQDACNSGGNYKKGCPESCVVKMDIQPVKGSSDPQEWSEKGRHTKTYYRFWYTPQKCESCEKRYLTTIDSRFSFEGFDAKDLAFSSVIEWLGEKYEIVRLNNWQGDCVGSCAITLQTGIMVRWTGGCVGDAVSDSYAYGDEWTVK